MTGMLSRRTFWACVALLALSAALNFPAPTRRVVAQSGGGSNPIDQSIVDAFRWRSIGPRSRRPLDRRVGREGPAAARPTSAPSAAASGRPPTAAPRGRR